ncbi:MAG: family 14 glycosylhydrolase [Richelia sp.]|nr:family 14 glycosylhydrolase [Richelia sp.]
MSTGTAGELRYPSYNIHDNWKYPHRGYFQAHSKPAIKSFQSYIIKKYSNIKAVNQAWQTQLSKVEQIQPPSNPEQFVKGKDYEDTQYGKDFIEWYNQSLIDHG